MKDWQKYQYKMNRYEKSFEGDIYVPRSAYESWPNYHLKDIDGPFVTIVPLPDDVLITDSPENALIEYIDKKA